MELVSEKIDKKSLKKLKIKKAEFDAELMEQQAEFTADNGWKEVKYYNEKATANISREVKSEFDNDSEIFKLKKIVALVSASAEGYKQPQYDKGLLIGRAFQIQHFICDGKVYKLDKPCTYVNNDLEADTEQIEFKFAYKPSDVYDGWFLKIV